MITRARKVYSPSQLSAANRCLARWTLRYVYGNRPPEMVTRGKTLGIIIHRCLEAYINGGSVNDVSWDSFERKDQQVFDAFSHEFGSEKLDALFADAPRRAITGLPYLPDETATLQRFAEMPFKLDVSRWRPAGSADVEFSDWSKIDLVAQANDGTWFLYDHKSTAGDKYDPFTYVPTAEALAEDVQLLLYAAMVLDLSGAEGLWCRWVYYYTGPKFAPQAIPVDVYVTRQHVYDRLQKWFALADHLSAIIDWTYANNTLPPLDQLRPVEEILHGPDSPCEDYRGCEHRQRCNPPPINPVNLLRKVHETREKEERETMGLAERLAAQRQAMPQTHQIEAPATAPAQWVQTPTGQYVTPEMALQYAEAHQVTTPAPEPTPEPAPQQWVPSPTGQGYMTPEMAAQYNAAQRNAEAISQEPLVAPPVETAPEPAPKAKRKRRSKAEIEAGRLHAHPTATGAGVTEITMREDVPTETIDIEARTVTVDTTPAPTFASLFARFREQASDLGIEVISVNVR